MSEPPFLAEVKKMKGLEYIEVSVQRGNSNTIFTDIPAYELAVLQQIHDIDTADGVIAMVRVVNEGMIRPLINDNGDPVEFDAQQALNAMRRKYDGNHQASPVLRVYNTARALAERVKVHDLDRNIGVHPDRPEPKEMTKQKAAAARAAA